jgi:hypothetical protein
MVPRPSPGPIVRLALASTFCRMVGVDNAPEKEEEHVVAKLRPPALSGWKSCRYGGDDGDPTDLCAGRVSTSRTLCARPHSNSTGSESLMVRRKRRRGAIPNSVNLQDGTTTSTYHGAFVYKGRESTRAVAVEPLYFERCPICFDSDNLTDEHVPMQALGGVVMTATCKRCNNDLGSSAEEELRRVFHAEVAVRAEAPGNGPLRGYRKATAFLRRSLGRDPVLLVDRAHPEFDQLLNGPAPVSMSYGLLDPFLAEVALAKYAYLAACLRLGEIPKSDAADAVRAFLTSARDGRIDDAKDLLPQVGRFWPFARVENGNLTAPILLIEPTSTQPGWLFVLAGAIAVRWPFPDIHPADGGHPNHVL